MERRVLCRDVPDFFILYPFPSFFLLYFIHVDLISFLILSGNSSLQAWFLKYEDTIKSSQEGVGTPLVLE